MKFLCAVLVVVALCGFRVDETLPDVQAEQRAQALFHSLKCVVCEGQPLNESDALLAREMRSLIRQKIAAGESDAAITGYLEQRYGSGIATSPARNWGNALLWLGPFVLLLGLLLRQLLTKKSF